MRKLSIIIPVYFNELNLEPVYADMQEKVFPGLAERGYDYELLFVDDGSKDKSLKVIRKLADADPNIRYLHLSRNFGSHAAILAGLSASTGDCAVNKAADLQEPSELILEMLDIYDSGYNVVLAVREDREEGFFQKAFANTYYWLIRHLSLKNMPKGGFDSFLIDRKVIDVLDAMEEKNTSLMGQVLWSGFRTAEVPYVRKSREIGESKWTLRKKLRLVGDSVFSFSYVPIRAIFGVGVFLFLLSVVWSIVLIVCRLTGAIAVDGFTTLAIICLFGFGLILLSLGVLGEYMWRIFDSARKRPPFIVEETSEDGEPRYRLL